MKTNKAFSGVLFFLAISIANAQVTSVEQFTVPLSDPDSPGKLIVQQIAGSIDVKAYEGKEVVVKAIFGNKKAHKKEDDKMEGLKRIEGSSISISAEENNNVVRIINKNLTTNLEIKVPVKFSLKLRTMSDGNINVEGVIGELEISNTDGWISLMDVSGSVSADTLNDDIKVVFNSIDTDASMAFSNLNGNIDVTFPKSLKANIKAKSDRGEILTDFDIVVDEQKPSVNTDTTSNTYKVTIEQWVTGKINGGGQEMLFKNYYGDILIRSK